MNSDKHPPHYSGSDLHARLLYARVIDQAGNTRLHEE